MQVIIDGLKQLVTALRDGRSLSGKDQLQKRHEHPDRHNREKDTTQCKERIEQYGSLTLGQIAKNSIIRTHIFER